MRKFLQDIVQKVIGLECIVIADRDGVPLVAVSDDKIPETALMSGLNSTFGKDSNKNRRVCLNMSKDHWLSVLKLRISPPYMQLFFLISGLASLQAAKIGLGEALTTICVYSSYQVVQMDLEGLSVTFVGATDCNTGHILAVSKEVSQALVELKSKTEIDVAQP